MFGRFLNTSLPGMQINQILPLEIRRANRAMNNKFFTIVNYERKDEILQLVLAFLK